jgi:phage terminase large subunit-like protein
MRTKGPGVARFFERYLMHTKGPTAGKPFILEPWQRDFVNEFYRVDEKGRRVYRLGVLGIPRGNGKSPLAAGFGLLEVTTKQDSPDVFCAAASKEQAGIVQSFARSFVEASPELQKITTAHKRVINCHPTNGVMRVVSSHGTLQHGLSPSAAIPDELHAFHMPEHEELYAALWSALHKRPDSFLLTITTAGWDKNTILGRIYDEALALPGEDRLGGCLRVRRDLENGVLFWWYGVPEERHGEWENEELWAAVNPATWFPLAELRRNLNAPGADANDFQRLHLNMWTATRDSWITPGAWGKLASDEEIPRKAPIWVAVDAAYSYDTTAVVWGTLTRDGRALLRSHVWSVRDDTPCDKRVPEATLDNERLVEPFIHALGDRYTIKEIVYDPRYFTTEGKHLAERFRVADMPQASGLMTDAVQAFYRHVHSEKIAHNGDKVLAAHVAATAGDKTEQGWKIRKLKQTRPIDATTAAVMCASRILRDVDNKPPQILWLPE